MRALQRPLSAKKGRHHAAATQWEIPGEEKPEPAVGYRVPPEAGRGHAVPADRAGIQGAEGQR